MATLDFIDVMIVDHDTTAFLLVTFPALRWWFLLTATATDCWHLHVATFLSLSARLFTAPDELFFVRAGSSGRNVTISFE